MIISNNSVIFSFGRAAFAKAAAMRLYDLRFYALMGAIMLYGCFGSPTPDHLGAVEMIIGALLIFAVGAGGAACLSGLFSSSLFSSSDLSDRRHFFDEIWFKAGRWLLIYGITIGLARGVMAGHPAGLIMRDMLAFLFMGLPIFCAPLFRGLGRGRLNFEDFKYARVLLMTSIFAGLMFCLRDLSGLAHYVIPVLGSAERLYYLANSPLVLMAALVTASAAIAAAYGIGCNRPMTHIMRSLVLIFVMLALASLPVAVMGVSLQRASLAAVVTGCLMVYGLLFLHAPIRGLVIVAALGTAGLFLHLDGWGALLIDLSEKTSLVGLNRRHEEWLAVWARLQGEDVFIRNVPDLLFGTGWGGTFSSPAVGHMEVNFTHGLLGSALLKTGLVGLMLSALYIGALAMRVLNGIISGALYSLRSFIVFIALLCPLLIDVFLYAAFKSLDFGILLLLCAFYRDGIGQDCPHGLVKTAKCA